MNHLPLQIYRRPALPLTTALSGTLPATIDIPSANKPHPLPMTNLTLDTSSARHYGTGTVPNSP